MDGLTGFQIAISFAAGAVLLLGAYGLWFLDRVDRPPRHRHKKGRGA